MIAIYVANDCSIGSYSCFSVSGIASFMRYYCFCIIVGFLEKKNRFFSFLPLLRILQNYSKGLLGLKYIRVKQNEKNCLVWFFRVVFQQEWMPALFDIQQHCPVNLYVDLCKYPLPLLILNFLRAFVLLFKSFPAFTHVPYIASSS